MTACGICGRTLDATETKMSNNVQIAKPGEAYIATVCADCILKYRTYRNERS